jgi:hypothetical protein
LLDRAGLDNYLRALKATAEFFNDNEEAYSNYGLVVSRITENGVSRTVVFTSKSGVPPELRETLTNLGVRLYNLTGLPKEQSHAEAASLKYRAANPGITVEDAYSTNRVCSGACAGYLTRFINRAGVKIPALSNGWLTGRVVYWYWASHQRKHSGLRLRLA